MSETNFRRRLKEAREAKGLSQPEFARLIGLGETNLSKLENGRRRIHLDEAILIANILDVPLYRMCSDEPIQADGTMR